MADMRVLIVVPKHESLRESAAKVLTAGAKRLSGRPPELPHEIEIDDTFAAVPIGRTGHTARPDLAMAATAPQFIIRGHVSKKHEAAMMADPRVFADPKIAAFPTTCGGTPAVGNADDVRRLLGALALQQAGLDGAGVAVAIIDTGINLAHLKARLPSVALDKNIKWTPPGVGAKAPGSWTVDHATMCAYDALIAAPKATLLDFPLLQSGTHGDSKMEGFLSDAIQAYSYLLQRKAASDWPYKALVVNNSWGMYSLTWDFPVGHPGRYADNPNHPFNITVGTLARSGADILFAAGNCGKQCPDDRCGGVTKDTINGANAHPDVLTVAGVDIKRKRVGYSSQGPAIAGMKHTKPDLASYTHFAGSEIEAGEPDTGTSAACPVAAGVVAALRTRIPVTALDPQDLARELKADADQPTGTTGWNANLGYGIVQPDKTAARLLASV